MVCLTLCSNYTNHVISRGLSGQRNLILAGCIKLENLLQLDLSFPFEVNSEGFQLLAVDFSNLIIFDFLQKFKDRLLEIETQGGLYCCCILRIIEKNALGSMHLYLRKSRPG